MEPQGKRSWKSTAVIAAVVAGVGLWAWSPWSSGVSDTQAESGVVKTVPDHPSVVAVPNCGADEVRSDTLDSVLHWQNSYPHYSEEVSCLTWQEASQKVAKRLEAIHASVDKTNAEADKLSAETEAFMRDTPSTGTPREQLVTLVHGSCDIERGSGVSYKYTYLTDASEVTIKRVIEWHENRPPVAPPSVNESNLGDDPVEPSKPELPFYGKAGKVESTYQAASKKFDELWGPAFAGVMTPELPNDFGLAVAKHCGTSGPSVPTTTVPESPDEYDYGYRGYCDYYRGYNPRTGLPC